MNIEQRLNCGHCFSYDTETKLLSVDDIDPEINYKMGIEDIKILYNMFKFLEDNKLL